MINMSRQLYILMWLICCIWFSVGIAQEVTQPAVTLSYMGEFRDLADQPLRDPIDLTFRMYDVAVDGEALWTERFSGVIPEEGIVLLTLGTQVVFPESLSDVPTLFLSVQLGVDE